MSCSIKVYGDSNEVDVEKELYNRGYIKKDSWTKAAFVIFDIETLERHGATDNSIEASLSLASVAIVDTMNEDARFYVVGNDDDDDHDGEDNEKDENMIEKEKMGRLFFYSFLSR